LKKEVRKFRSLHKHTSVLCAERKGRKSWSGDSSERKKGRRSISIGISISNSNKRRRRSRRRRRRRRRRRNLPFWLARNLAKKKREESAKGKRSGEANGLEVDKVVADTTISDLE
jgi:hypothetical protein